MGKCPHTLCSYVVAKKRRKKDKPAPVCGWSARLCKGRPLGLGKTQIQVYLDVFRTETGIVSTSHIAPRPNTVIWLAETTPDLTVAEMQAN